MNSSEAQPESLPPPEVRADAAAWLTSMRDPDRTADVEEGFRLWLAEDPRHGAAFELATETWDRAALLSRRPAERVASWERSGFHVSLSRAAVAVAAVALIAVLATAFYFHNAAVTTGVGEQRALTLVDGTRVFLNTGTRVAIDYDRQRRHLDLKQGEALFEVAKDTPNRPFVVTAGGRAIEALATSFVVRSDPRLLSVTLVEGRVAVDSDAVESDRVIMEPGQRLTFKGRTPPKLDTPVLDKVTAWQHGQVAFDNTALSDAVAEMNRYSTAQLVVERPETAAVHVSGVFRTGDNVSFAQAMAETYHLRRVDAAGKIILSGVAVMPQE